MERLEVHKFGGTSLAGAERLQSVARLVAESLRHARLVVVASAMGGVTDILIEAAEAVAAGARARGLAGIDEVVARHEEALSILGVRDAAAIRADLGSTLDGLRALVKAVGLLGELPPRTRDRILAVGEKLSCRLLAATLRRDGVPAVAVDADSFLETNGRFGEADPLGDVADRKTRATLQPHLAAGRVPVVTGFCGRAPDGATTTLGRGGSDFSATLLAGALDADEVTIWTDVEGIFSAHPNVVPDARVVEQLNYREAAELSFYGAKVLHQRTMIPVAARGIPVRIRSAFCPEAPGTVVDNRFTPGSHPVKAISAIPGQCLVSIEGKGMAGVPGVAARAFGALAAREISVTMISQSSSESSICLAVPEQQAEAASAALRGELRLDLGRGDVEEITVRSHVEIVAAVGLGMARQPGVSARVFSALAAARINVLAIAQGSSELNISLAVDEREVGAALRAIHAEFGLHRRDTGVDSPEGFDLMLLGCGRIGRALVELVLDRRAEVFDRFGLRARVVAIADRSGYLLAPAGLPREVLDAALAAKGAGRPVASLAGAVASADPAAMVRAAASYRLSRPVLVDVSDADDAHLAFLAALGEGCDIVTANKKPLAGPVETWRVLESLASETGRLLKLEATVGAGLPVVDTLEMLLATGDRLTAAEGCFSGTLGFILARLEEGVRFSDAVAEAEAAGYTEPDPVTDLSGADVARKALILGRISGLVTGDAGVALTGLVDPALAGLDAASRAEALLRYDAPLAESVAAARDRGEVLRYVAHVTDDCVVVGPRAVGADSPLGRLRGTDNIVVLHSERYRERPLVIIGPGAGVEVTAMGVLGDILRVAAERR